MKAAATDLWIVGLITAVGCAHLHAADLTLAKDEKPNSAIVTAGDSLAPDSLDRLVGQPADIAESAYLYRADRKPEENAPESWFAVMRYAGMPLDKPVDVSAPAVKRVLIAMLWEEIRPVRRVQLSWPAGGSRRPPPDELTITTLDNRGTASSWWNNLTAVAKAVRPTASADGRSLEYDLKADTCGLVISLGGGKAATEYDVPDMHVLVADTWKKMDVEIEWGFEHATAERDYSGRIETYDGLLAGLRPLEGDTSTAAAGSTAWRSVGKGGQRRGVRATLLYLGTSRWRKVLPFTSQADDVARTIVTVWTNSGSFSFLAADLQNGPILAPEYGFFVRRKSAVVAPPNTNAFASPTSGALLSSKMDSIAGSKELLGWGSDETPWFGGNSADKLVAVRGITLPPRTVAMHPGAALDVAVHWRSPITATVNIKASLAHAQSGGNGIEWWVLHQAKTGRKDLAHGLTNGSGAQKIPADAPSPTALDALAVESGDLVSLRVGPKGAHQCDTNLVELVIAEVGGSHRAWTLTHDVVGSIHAGNPHADDHGNADVWEFSSEESNAASFLWAATPPIELASNAANAREFLDDLHRRNLSTIRQRILAHEEQTWEGAVTALRGGDLPAHPPPPAGFEPRMQVEVPCPRLTAQWNLGVWHLVRHCEKHPNSGRLWFNDHPYGILAAETYMILAALDLMGSHREAEDGFDQWVSLPVDNGRPTGLFSEGRGCLTNAVGPPGAGGHMDGVHSFGPGSMGWALVEHFLLTGDKRWFQTSAPRIKANVEWMLRQRRVVQDMVPGGDRLWCKGLQPALQVTPDSGGLWMQFYECEAYYWIAVAHFAEALAKVDPAEGARLKAEAEAYRRDLLAAVERSITLSPVVPVRDGTYHSTVPLGCYVRGLSTGAWGWNRDGSGSHVGPMYWETVQSAAALISPAGVLSPRDVRVQGYLDVLEDRLLLENANAAQHDWFVAGWQYQSGLERTANMHLAADDVPAFLRSFLNGYAVDILPKDGYTFNEHAVHGPPDKIFEEAAFLERFRNLLVMEDGDSLWLARATPRAWLQLGKRIAVRNAPTHFGMTAYQIVSDADNGKIAATVEMPQRSPPRAVLLRLRHPKALPMKTVKVNGKDWHEFDPAKEIVRLQGIGGKVSVEVSYR